MLPVNTLIKRIRTRCHDIEKITYDDEEILDVINMGLRFIRRTIADLQPAKIIETYEGTIAAGEKSFKLPFIPLKIVHLTIGDKVIKSETIDTSPKVFQNYNQVWRNPLPIYTTKQVDTYREQGIKNTDIAHKIGEYNDLKGIPKEFYITDGNVIHFVPIPNQKYKFSFMYIEDIEELTADDKSPLSTDFDDFLIEYASIRLQVGNEFNMADEQNLLANIYEQLRKMLIPPPVGFVVKGYF